MSEFPSLAKRNPNRLVVDGRLIPGGHAKITPSGLLWVDSSNFEATNNFHTTKLTLNKVQDLGVSQGSSDSEIIPALHSSNNVSISLSISD